MSGTRQQHNSLLKAICFITIGVMLFALLTYIMEPAGIDVQLCRSFFTEQKNSLNAVYVGGSICANSWMPYIAWDECGFTSYSFGQPGLDSYYMLPMIKEVLAYQSPDVLLLDLRPFQYAGEKKKKKATGLALSSTFSMLSPNRYAIALGAYQFADNVGKKDTLDTFLLDLTRYHGRWKKINDGTFPWVSQGQYSHGTKGYRFDPGKEAILLSDLSSVTDEAAVDMQAQTDLESIMAYLKTKGQKALFLVSSYQEKADERSQFNYLANLIQANGFDYINLNNYNAQMGMDAQNDYFDNAHLNTFGAEKYTKFVANYVATNYNLADHRGDAMYEDWEKGTEQWSVLLAQMKEEINNLPDDTEKETADD